MAQLQVDGALATPNTIDFDIPGSGLQTIAPQSPLPAATAPVVIDGTTQTGFSGTPLIVLDGIHVQGVPAGSSWKAATARSGGSSSTTSSATESCSAVPGAT